MNKLLLLLLVVLLAANRASAQRLPNSWFKIGYDIAPEFIGVDASQQAYVLNGSNLQKYSATGVSQWRRELCGAAGLALTATGTACCVSGTAGEQGCAFGNGVAVAGAAAGPRAGYLVSYDAGGTAQWVRPLGASRGTTSFGVAADEPRGLVYSTGSFADNAVLYQTTALGAAGWAVRATGSGQVAGRAGPWPSMPARATSTWRAA